MNRRLLLLCLPVVLPGCVDPGFTSLEEGKLLNQLDADEEVEICEDSKAYVERTIGYDTWHRGDCMNRTLLYFFPGDWPNAEGTIEICEQRLQECSDGGDPSGFPATQFCTTSPLGWPVGCGVTVGDFVECSAEQFDAYVELAELGCDEIDFAAEQAPILPEDCSVSLDCADPP